MAQDDVRESQIRVRMNQRSMENLPRETKADETNVQGILHNDILSAAAAAAKSGLTE